MQTYAEAGCGINVRTRVSVDMRIDMCTGMRIDMRIDACIGELQAGELV